MSISQRDRDFMEEVAVYYRNTKDANCSEGSIKDTAETFGLSRNKIRKILITTGDIKNELTEKAISLREKGKTVDEIAGELGVSKATVSVYLPYTKVVKGTLDPSPHAKAVRDYREYEKQQADRQVQNTQEKSYKPKRASWKKDTQPESSDPVKPVRLHMELIGDLTEYDKKTIREFGELNYGEHISRDVLVPSDIPLYAVHYLIQRLFGWQNSHLHRFELPEKQLMRLTENKMKIWARLVGIIFRSPFMNEDDEFWADDYESGSFKNWLTKKYMGPYLSLCHGEGLVSCAYDMKDYLRLIIDNPDCNVSFVKYSEDDIRVMGFTPVSGKDGNINPKTAPKISFGETWVETVKFAEIPVCGLLVSDSRDSFDLLERLPISNVLTAKPTDLSGTELIDRKREEIKMILKNKIDAPERQVLPAAFTDVLIYNYDFGDDWHIEITMTENCDDLIAQHRLSSEQLNRSVQKCRRTYRPVTLAVDGEMLLDDIGGLGGFAEFLRNINPDLDNMTEEEKEEAQENKDEYLGWAYGVQNWKKLSPMI